MPEIDLPTPEIRAKRSISIVWIVPAVAALIGLWLGVKAWMEKGPTVVIAFQTAEGLEAGKTRIRYKDVEIGKVEAIQLSSDLSQVLVRAQLVKDAENYVSESSRFWVVRARVSAAQVSALGTLLSGAYIGMDPGKPGKYRTTFKGLEKAPNVITGQPGRLFVLKAERLGSLDAGSPIYHRQVKVGEVVGCELDKDSQAVSIQVFVLEPHSRLVRRDTRFWNAGGISMKVDTEGVKVAAESLSALVLGGIAFENPVSLDPSPGAAEGTVFPLFENRDKIFEKTYLEKHYYVLSFRDSVRGLRRGAPVEFRGIPVGEVADIRLEFHTDRMEARIPVLIALEPERMALLGTRTTTVEQAMERLVARGLRAQLKTGSLLTGKLFVDLDFHPEAPPRRVDHRGTYPELPTAPKALESVMANLNAFLDRLRRLPLESLVQELRATVPTLRTTLEQARVTLARADAETLPRAQATLEQAQKTLQALEQGIVADAPVPHDLRKALEAFQKAAASVQALTDYLAEHPNALIFGKKRVKR